MKRPILSDSLYRLIYCSRNTISQVIPTASTQEGLETEVRAILSAARERNKLNGVTGALLFTASGFAQVLEGPREIVEQTFERINGDPRHAGVTVLSFTPTERRSFPDWAMGFCSHATAASPDPLEHLLTDASSSQPRVTTGSDILRMLEAVVQRDDEWIAA